MLQLDRPSTLPARNLTPGSLRPRSPGLQPPSQTQKQPISTPTPIPASSLEGLGPIPSLSRGFREGYSSIIFAFLWSVSIPQTSWPFSKLW